MKDLNDWQIDIVYEFAMNYTDEALKYGYWKHQETDIDSSNLTDPDMGYTEEEAAEMLKK